MFVDGIVFVKLNCCFGRFNNGYCGVGLNDGGVCFVGVVVFIVYN